MAETPVEDAFAVPSTCSTDHISREADDEWLLHDEKRQQDHRLNHCASSVWRTCNGNRTVADIVRQFAGQQLTPIVTEESVRESIGKLASADLFIAPPSETLHVLSPSCSGLIKQAAIAAGAAIAVPVVISLTASKAVFASGVVEGGLCAHNHSCPDMVACCHRPGYGVGDRCWSDANFCVIWQGVDAAD